MLKNIIEMNTHFDEKIATGEPTWWDGVKKTGPGNEFIRQDWEFE